jgi:hypothetical protein
MAATKRVHLVKKMNLNVDNNITLLEAGKSHEFPAEWFVQDANGDYPDMYYFVMAHSDDPPNRPPKDGTPEWAAQKRDLEASQILLDKVMAQQAVKNMQSPKRGR